MDTTKTRCAELQSQSCSESAARPRWATMSDEMKTGGALVGLLGAFALVAVDFRSGLYLACVGARLCGCVPKAHPP